MKYPPTPTRPSEAEKEDVSEALKAPEAPKVKAERKRQSGPKGAQITKVRALFTGTAVKGYADVALITKKLQENARMMVNGESNLASIEFAGPRDFSRGMQTVKVRYETRPELQANVEVRFHVTVPEGDKQMIVGALSVKLCRVPADCDSEKEEDFCGLNWEPMRGGWAAWKETEATVERRSATWKQLWEAEAEAAARQARSYPWSNPRAPIRWVEYGCADVQKHWVNQGQLQCPMPLFGIMEGEGMLTLESFAHGASQCLRPQQGFKKVKYLLLHEPGVNVDRPLQGGNVAIHPSKDSLRGFELLAVARKLLTDASKGKLNQADGVVALVQALQAPTKIPAWKLSSFAAFNGKLMIAQLMGASTIGVATTTQKNQLVRGVLRRGEATYITADTPVEIASDGVGRSVVAYFAMAPKGAVIYEQAPDPERGEAKVQSGEGTFTLRKAPSYSHEAMRSRRARQASLVETGSSSSSSTSSGGTAAAPSVGSSSVLAEIGI